MGKLTKATMQASFGPGRYTTYGCVDFAIEGASSATLVDYGIWLGNTPLSRLHYVNQIYLSAYTFAVETRVRLYIMLDARLRIGSRCNPRLRTFFERHDGHQTACADRRLLHFN